MRLRPLLLAAALVATGCASDDGVVDRDPTEDEALAIAALVGADLPIDEQRCVLQGILDLEIDPQQIVDRTLSADTDGSMLAAAAECVDDLASLDPFVQSFIDGAAESGTVLSVEEARCSIRALEADDREAAILECLGDRVSDGGDYGDDQILDLLWDQCTAGNAQACDELYRDAPIGSRYETYGRTCGDRLVDSAGLECFEQLG
jgi:hypothetical protein